ncbi:NADH:flavin oxidoreductase [Microbulbifer agarilyticus]|uniref:NADH:flavin oxidoreductase n=1 Tax=Microbulbifer agarilyticus TaxID=260552 RepID=UPI001CD7695E|nr:NADH:flavin oxidoreductase [Microbulbifer agarilyticus]MCA0893274.1 NADH:flavin oxidoreductase [Microbulbifer agarilyticus]
MSEQSNPLFTPFSVKSLTLQNRVAMAPMTREFSPGGIPGDDVAGYYRRRAEGGTGLIITEGTTVNDPVASLSQRVPEFHGEPALTGWKKVVEDVHAAGGKIFPQLWHVGTARDARKSANPELPSAGPSGLLKPGKQIAEPMTTAHIERVIGAFAEAAADAQKLGFDGVELHGAHGYLIDQFFWEGTNQRSDAWGGSMAKRGQFAVEIIKAVRAATGPDFPIMLRYSQWKQQDYTARLAQTPQELHDFLAPLADAGVDLFHCSQRRYWEPEFEGSDLNLAGWTKELTGKPTVTVGSVSLDGDFFGAFAGQSSETRAIDDLLTRLERGEFDLVAVGRALLQDPQWANKVRASRLDELQSFNGESLARLT